MHRRTRKPRSKIPKDVKAKLISQESAKPLTCENIEAPLSTEKDYAKRVSSGIVVIRRLPDGTPLFLLLRAWGHWDFPKGAVESNETILEAAIREVAEESAQTKLSFPWGTGHASTSVYNKDKIAHYFVAFSSDPVVKLLPNPITKKKEHDHFLWATWSDLSRLLPPRLQPVVDWIARILGLPNVELAPFSFRLPPKIAFPTGKNIRDEKIDEEKPENKSPGP